MRVSCSSVLPLEGDPDHLASLSPRSRASSASEEGMVGIGGRRSALGPLACDTDRDAVSRPGR